MSDDEIQVTDLLADLERGPGSRELSDEVLLALGWSTREFNSPGHGTVGHTWIMPGGGEPMIRPSPTESVDDALALVPEGWSVLDLGEGMGEREGWFWCTLHKRGVIETNDDVDGETRGANVRDCMARAICIAVLQSV